MDRTMKGQFLRGVVAFIIFVALCIIFTGHNRHLKRCGNVVIRSGSSCDLEAAFLARLREKVKIILDHPSIRPGIRRRILSRWDGTVHELDDQSNAPAVSTGKREVRLCLKGSPTEDAALFVILHEMAHIGCISTGHTDEFWDCMRSLLSAARSAGVYTDHDASSKVFGTAIGNLP